MTIRQRIIKLNIIIAAILLLALVASAAVFWEGTGVQYEEVLEGVLQDEDMIYTVQGYLHAYWEELGNQEDFQKAAEGEAIQLQTTDRMKQIEGYIDQTGYRFAIYVGDIRFVNKLTNTDMDCINKMGLLKDNSITNNVVVQENDGTNIIIATPYRKDWNITGVAVRLPGEEPTGTVHTLQETATKYLTMAMLLTVAVIIGSSFFYSLWLKRHVLGPLENLQRATEKISHGNLADSLETDKEDEIGAVYHDFEHMRQQLQTAEQERLEYESYKAELLAGISHDLRSPLTSIKGYAEGMLDGIADTKEKRERYCRAILERSYDMERLADSLGTYMSLETGKMKLYFEKLELNQYLWEYIHQNQDTEFDDWNVIFDVKLCEEKLLVEIDRNQMNRVLNNLIQNSVKYRIKDNSTICVRTEVIRDKEKTNALITITDDGPGVNAESLPHIFECFYRGDTSRTKQGKGSGLGLSIVKQIIIGHHGVISASSNGGLSIQIQIPVIE